MVEQPPDSGRSQVRGGGLATASLVLGVICLLQQPLIFGGGLKLRIHPSLLPVGAYSLFACLLLGVVGLILGVIALTVRRSPTRRGVWRAVFGVAANALTLLLIGLLFVVSLLGACGSC